MDDDQDQQSEDVSSFEITPEQLDELSWPTTRQRELLMGRHYIQRRTIALLDARRIA